MMRTLQAIVSSLFLAVALLSSSTANAGELEDRASVMLAEAIQVATSGDFDKWINKFCDPQRCHTPLSKNQWKAYQLKKLKANGAACLVDGKVTISRWAGGLSIAPNKAKAYVNCTGRALPPPVEFRWDKETDKLYIRAISI